MIEIHQRRHADAQLSGLVRVGAISDAGCGADGERKGLSMWLRR